MIDIKFEKEKDRSVAFDTEKEKIVGVCELIPKEDIFVIEHTEVSPEYKGMGIAKKLVDKVAEEMRIRDKKLKASCSYAQKLFDKSDEYNDVVAE